MAKILKVKLDLTQKSSATWLVTTIKKLIIKPVEEFGIPVLSFKLTQEAVLQNSQILSEFNVNLGGAIKAHKGIPLDYGSEFRDIAQIKNLFCHHKYKDIIVDIIKKLSR